MSVLISCHYLLAEVEQLPDEEPERVLEPMS
jgi:hypothetical protein